MSIAFLQNVYKFVPKFEIGMLRPLLKCSMFRAVSLQCIRVDAYVSFIQCSQISSLSHDSRFFMQDQTIHEFHRYADPVYGQNADATQAPVFRTHKRDPSLRGIIAEFAKPRPLQRGNKEANFGAALIDHLSATRQMPLVHDALLCMDHDLVRAFPSKSITMLLKTYECHDEGMPNVYPSAAVGYR